MKHVARLLAFLITLPALAGTVTPTWTFTDFGLDALTVKKMRVTPLAPYGTNGSGIITGDWRERTTDTNGSVTITNMANGYSYEVTFHGLKKTSFTNSFSGSVTGAVNAVDYISSSLITDAGLVAYSKAQANGIFLTKTNPAMVGMPTWNGTNWTAFLGGGSGTTYTNNPALPAGVISGGGIGTNTSALLPATNGEWVGWFDEWLLPFYGVGSKTDLDQDYLRLEREEKANALERIEHERFERARDRGKYVEREVAKRTMLGALKTFHGIVKAADERNAPNERLAKLKELGVSQEIVMAFHEFDLNLGREITDERERKCAALGAEA